MTIINPQFCIIVFASHVPKFNAGQAHSFFPEQKATYLKRVLSSL